MSQPEADPKFEVLLDYLKHNRGCDLTGYKRSTLMRRFRHRMHSIHIPDYQSYLQYLQNHPEEYLVLLNDVLINVTHFFRDRDTWDYLSTHIIPRIIASRQPDELIRVWSAGCAAGQEIYSILILFAETLGVEACVQRVQCFATDIDEHALQQARKGNYSHLEVKDMPADLLEKYFQETERGYVFHPKLRRTIVFGRHNLEKDAPMSKIDLLMCRNVLIYFNPEAQASILVRFHFALKNTGFLLLGKSETLVNRREIFTPVYAKHRVYAKGTRLELEDHLSVNLGFQKKQLVDPLPSQSHFWQTAFETSPVAQFAINLDGYLVGVNQQATLLFGITLDDWGCPFQDLKPGRLIASHTSAKTIYYNRYPVTFKDIKWNTAKDTRYFDVTIAPVFNAQKQLLGNILSFLETTDSQQLIDKLERSDSELERVFEKLQATEAELEAVHQEIQLLTQDAFDQD